MASRPVSGVEVVVLGADRGHPVLPPRPDVAFRMPRSEDEAADSLERADAVLVWHQSGLLERAWDRAGRVRWIQVGAAGVERTLFPALVASEVVVTNARGVFDDGMAEYAFGLLLALAKDLPGTLEAQRERTWRHRVVRGLAGARLVVIGAGSIGRAIARQGRAFGMDVVAVASRRREDPELGTIRAPEALPEVLAGADAIIVVAPLTPATRGLVGRRELARVRDALLVNVGRGPVLDEDAALEALRDGRLAGAGLDVFTDEPLPPDSPWWTTPGVIVSPHIGGDVHGFEARLEALFAENLDRFVAGQPLLNVVDKRLGYPTGR